MIARGLASSLQTLEDAFAQFVRELYGSLLPRGLRELLILHISWHAESELLWTAHLAQARSLGISDLQIAAIQQGQVEAFVFNSEESSLLRILFDRRGPEGGEAWNRLTMHFSPEQIHQVFMTERFYLTVATGLSHDESNSSSRPAAEKA
jgi:alkylhydroperoxidase family enzyme